MALPLSSVTVMILSLFRHCEERSDVAIYDDFRAISEKIRERIIYSQHSLRSLRMTTMVRMK